MNILMNGELIALMVAFCWTFTVMSFETAGKEVGSLSVNIIRLVIGLIFICTYTLFTRGLVFPIDASASTWFWLLLSGVVGLAIGDLFLFQAFIDVGSRISMLIMTLSPSLTLALDYLVFGYELSYLKFLGMFVVIISIALVIVFRNNNNGLGTHKVRGLIFAFLGALGQSVGLILSKQGMQEYDAFASTQIRIIAALVTFIIIITFKKEWLNVFSSLRKKRAMKFITIGSLFGPFLGVSLSLLAMKYTSAAVAQTISQTNVILLIPFTAFFFKEKVSKNEIMFSIFAFIGVAIMFL